MGATAATQGYYAQAQDGVTFDGSQLTDKMDDIVAAGAVAQFAGELLFLLPSRGGGAQVTGPWANCAFLPCSHAHRWMVGTYIVR